MENYLSTSVISLPFVLTAWKYINYKLRIKFPNSFMHYVLIVVSALFYPAVLPALWLAIISQNIINKN